ncbi:hypothetical protein [Nesterenkonia jeotgali]|uniref:Uncharacterized protein n=1 Tax=Nesterenkonia jeotgali TaxID=317018 RepID=A0A839FPU2_9MICC|nr:hypothetical protein [Nesterenkonia jeotgali]MBA8920382.1 hypothetical protein [Nesterenkonia jeotgali]
MEERTPKKPVYVMVQGMPIGTFIGRVSFDNLALRIGVGMALGVAFTAMFDPTGKAKGQADPDPDDTDHTNN